MNIFFKLTIAFVIVASSVGVIAYWSVRTTSDIDRHYVALVDETLPVIDSLERLNFAALKIVSSISESGFLQTEIGTTPQISGDASPLDGSRESFQESLALYRTLVTRNFPEEKEFLDRIEQTGDELLAGATKLLRSFEDPSPDSDIFSNIREFANLELAFFGATTAALGHEDEELAKRRAAVTSATSSGERSIIVVALVALVAAIIVGFVAARIISRPIKKLRDAADMVGEGKIGARVDILTKDEIGDLASSFNEMAASLDHSTEQHEILVEDLRRASHENLVLAEIGRIVNSSFEIDEVYRRIGSQLKNLIHYDRLTISIINLEDQTSTNVFTAGLDIPDFPVGRSFPLVNSSNGLVVSTKATQLILPKDEGDLVAGMAAGYRAGIKSFLLVPLLSQGEVISVLRLQSFGPNAYGDDDVRLAESAGAQIASAVINANQYSKIIKANQEIQDLARFPSEDPNPVARVSKDGTILFANDAATKLLAVRGLKTGDLALEDWRGPIKDILTTGIPQEMEIDYGDRVISYSLVPVSSGGYVNFYGRDITAIRQVDRLKDEFVSTVSHELRTPLTSIKGAAELLLEVQDEDPTARMDFLNIIDKESDRLTRLINDMLDLATIKSGQLHWQVAEVDPLSAINAAMDGIRAVLARSDIEVTVEANGDLPAVNYDFDKLFQVITNLLSNAIKFTQAKGSIRLKARFLADLDHRNGTGMAEISVSDTGIGIPLDEVERIFNRFEQAGTGSVGRPQGSGLGLAISKEIVEYMGGTIWVESQLGIGSTFFFTAPAAVEADTSPTG